MAKNTTVAIDIGNSNCVVSRAPIGRNIPPGVFCGIEPTGQYPSQVFFSENEGPIVGTMAAFGLQRQPERTVKSPKKYIGSDKVFTIGDETLTPEQVIAHMSRTMITQCQTDVGQNLDDAEVAITVPVSWSPQIISNLLEEYRNVGIDVDTRYVFSECAAAAYYVGNETHTDLNEKRILTIDIGAGTTDIIKGVFHNDNEQVRIETEKIGGDGNLGGFEFNQVVYENIIGQLNLGEITPKNNAALYAKAESIKEQLSKKDDVTDLQFIDGVGYDLEVKYEDYVNACQPLLSRIVEVVSDVVDGKENEIDFVVMTGGCSLVPAIHDAILERYPMFADKMPVINPMFAVCLGACALAKSISTNDEMESYPILDVSPSTYCITAKNNGRVRAFPHVWKGDKRPVSFTKAYYVPENPSDVLTTSLYRYESEDREVKHFELEDGVEIAVIEIPRPEKAKEGTEILVTVSLLPTDMIHVVIEMLDAVKTLDVPMFDTRSMIGE